MRIFLSILLTSTLFVCSIPTASAEESSLQPRVQEWIIKFKDSITNSQKDAILQKYQLKELSTITNGNITLVSLQNKNNLVDQLSNLDPIEFVEPNYKVTTSYTPSDHSYTRQWYASKVNMPKAWNYTKGDSDIKVAVIDAGLQTTHPDLRGKLIKPYNAVTGRTSLPSSVHGTHVVGIIGAASNKIGITGIAPNVKIIPVNVFEGEAADIYTVADGIDYAVSAGADIINLSLTTEDYTDILDYSIQSAVKKGVVVVAAVGNDRTSRPQYPAAYKNVIAVSATTKLDQRASFSNYGSYIHLSAPGVGIFSTAPGSTYISESGTSMAAPIVSGISALILSKNPFLSPSEVTDILQKSSVDLGTKGWDKYYGYGRVDAYKALVKTPAPISSITTSSKTFTYTGTNRLSLSFSAKKGTKISVYIKNANNEIIRRLASDQKWNGGTFSTKWDGKMDNGAYTPAGKVKIMVKVTNGKHSVYKGKDVNLKDNAAPAITLEENNLTYSLVNQPQLNIPFQVNKKSRVTAILYDQTGNSVKTLAEEKVFAGGKQTLTWDGNDTIGTYTLKLSITDLNERAGKPKNMSINVIE